MNQWKASEEDATVVMNRAWMFDAAMRAELPSSPALAVDVTPDRVRPAFARPGWLALAALGSALITFGAVQFGVVMGAQGVVSAPAAAKPPAAPVPPPTALECPVVPAVARVPTGAQAQETAIATPRAAAQAHTHRHSHSESRPTPPPQEPREPQDLRNVLEEALNPS